MPSTSPLISIILPVYNASKFLPRCINSVLNQTLTDFELIIIDDGSSDDSGKICKSYADKDPRIRFVSQENQGASAARNKGLSLATGEFIGFIDSDDWIDKKMFQTLYNNAIQNNVNISICNLYFSTDTQNLQMQTLPYFGLLSKKIFYKMLFNENGFGGYSWTKLIKREIITTNNIIYDTQVKYCEDFLFFFDLFKIVDKVFYDPTPLYFYYRNPDSVTQQEGITPAAKTAITGVQKYIKKEKNWRMKIHLRAYLVLRALGFIDQTPIDSESPEKTNLQQICKQNVLFFFLDTYQHLGRKKSFFPILYPRFYNFIKKIIP